MATLFCDKFSALSFDIASDTALSDFISFDNGYAFSSDDYLYQGKYRIITIGNVNDGYVDTSKVNFLDEVPTKIVENYLLHIGDVVISLTGNVGRTAMIKEDNLLLNQRVARIVPKVSKTKPFFYCLFRQPQTKAYLENISKGTAQANLSPVELLKTKVDYRMNDIMAFSDIANPIMNAILDISKEIASLNALLDTYLTTLSC